MEKLIIECVLRSALIALGTATALYILGVKAARVRHGVWASVVALMLMMPAWTAWGPKAVLHVMKPQPAAVAVQPVVETVQLDVAAPIVEQSSEWNWENYLTALYLLGFVVLMARLLTGTAHARMLVRRAASAEGRLTSDSCVAPITVGCLNPVVILPEGWTEWSNAQLNAVLAHEGEHARRRDPLVQWLALLNRAVFWFHPLSWWLSRRLSALSEEACDDAVLVRGHDPVQYSECLLGLARAVRQSGARVSAVGMAMPGTFLPQRIRRIAAGTPVQRISRTRMACVAVTCSAVSMLFTAGVVGYAAPLQSNRAAVGEVATQLLPGSDGFAQPLLHSRGSEGLPHTKVNVLVAQAQANPAPNPDARFTRSDGLHLATPASSAATDQSLSGTVMDPSGAVVPNAPVTLTNTDTGASISASTDVTGRYRFQNIDAGTYSMSIRAPGFKAETQTGIHVTTGDTHNGGAMLLQLGMISASVSVTGSKSTATGGMPIGNLLAPKPAMPIGIPLDRTQPATQPALEARYRAVGVRQADQTGSGGPIRVGGNVQAARLVNPIKPVYSAELKQEGVQGTVKLEAVLTKDGTLSDIQVIPTNIDPRLTQAALDAVKQWQYNPTLLDGQPVETLTTIDVNFFLEN